MTVSILQGDCRQVLRTLPDESVHTVVTSPPYWGLRDYGVPPSKIADVPYLVRNKRSVWDVATAPYTGAHFATFPPALIEPCILASCPEGGTVLDPFIGSGTTGLVADRLQRNCIGIELSAEYCEMARRRITDDAPLLTPMTESERRADSIASYDLALAEKRRAAE